MKKFLLTILSLVLMVSVVDAKDPELMWEKTWGEDQDIHETFIAVDSYNDVHYAVGVKTTSGIYAGFAAEPTSGFQNSKKNKISNDKSVKFNSASNPIFKESGDSYYYGVVVKYDKDGNVLWEKINQEIFAFFQTKTTNDGGVLALGLCAIAPNSNGNNYPVMLVKYDKNGNIEWEKIFTDLYTGQESYNTSSIDISKNNDIVLMIGGYEYRQILKLDDKGNTIWTKNFEYINSNNEYSYYDYSFLDKNDNIVLIGDYSTYLTDSNDNGVYKYYKTILKYDINGYLKFNKKIEIDDYIESYFWSINQDLDGNYVILSTNIVYDENYNRELDRYLALEIYDENGNYKETKKISNYSSDDEANNYELMIDKSGKYIINFYGYYNMISKKYDKDGNLIWKNTGDFKNALFDLDIDEYNNYIYVGGVAGTYKQMPQSSAIKFEKTAPNELTSPYYLVDAYIEKFSTDYMINKETEGEGTVEVNLDNAKAGEEITIEAKAAPGYRIDKIIVTDKDGNVIEVSGNKFVMPSSDVTVKVIFTNSPLVNPKTGAISITFAVLSISVYAFFQYKYFKNKEMNL